jgi:hypothetical protein
MSAALAFEPAPSDEGGRPLDGAGVNRCQRRGVFFVGGGGHGGLFDVGGVGIRASTLLVEGMEQHAMRGERAGFRKI